MLPVPSPQNFLQVPNSNSTSSLSSCAQSFPFYWRFCDLYSIDSPVLYHCSTPSPLIDVAVPPKNIIDVVVDDSNHRTQSGRPPRTLALPIETQASAALSLLFGSSSTNKQSKLGASVDDPKTFSPLRAQTPTPQVFFSGSCM